MKKLLLSFIACCLFVFSSVGQTQTEGQIFSTKRTYIVKGVTPELKVVAFDNVMQFFQNGSQVALLVAGIKPPPPPPPCQPGICINLFLELYAGIFWLKDENLKVIHEMAPKSGGHALMKIMERSPKWQLSLATQQ
jgi:hypothetical protein